MDYRGSLDYLYGLQRFGIKLGLDNIRALLEDLGNPQRDFPVVHVGGTNGKGSVSAALAAILRQGGYRVGLYTSPHLLSFTERIRIDAETISESDVASLTDELRSLVRPIPATFFEFTTALALCYFQRRKVDIAILEVGMGGRLDATNVVEPCLTVLTPVSIDHAEHLGKDLPKIAAEKAGIIKSGVPVVSARQPREALDVIRNRSGRVNAPLDVCGEAFRAEASDVGFNFIGFGKNITDLQTSLIGAHQFDNMALAVAAAQILAARGFECTDGALRQGLRQVDWPGRLEWWQGSRTVLLDGAHNIASMQALAAYLETLELPVRLRWVVGFKGDKDYRALLAEILPFAKKVYVCEPPSETAVERSEIVTCVTASGSSAQGFASVEDALKEALREKRTGEIVLVAGSLFLVAAARKWLLALKGASV
ncbi:MAG: folylpolyglutamate synthase/dihydrofolate synthase family protein [Desulfuromonadales bacterium]